MVSAIPVVLLDSIKHENQYYYMTDKPKLLPYLLRGLPLLLAGILWCIIDVSFLIRISIITSDQAMRYFIPFISIHLIPFYLGILNIIRLVLIYNNTHYAFSDQKLFICHGIFKKEVQVVKFSDIEEMKVRKTVFDKFFKTGTITIEICHREDSEEEEELIELISIVKYLTVYKSLKKYFKKQKKLERLIENIIDKKSVS